MISLTKVRRDVDSVVKQPLPIRTARNRGYASLSMSDAEYIAAADDYAARHSARHEIKPPSHKTSSIDIIGNVPKNPREIQDNARYRPEMIEYLLAQKYTHMLCLAYHRTVSPERLRDDMQLVYRDLRPKCDRRREIYTEAVAYVERVPGNTHTHWLLRFGSTAAELRFQANFPLSSSTTMWSDGGKSPAWSKYATNGTYHAALITDSVAATIYAAKTESRDADWTARLDQPDLIGSRSIPVGAGSAVNASI